ncbi:MAG: DUF4129 domain-containing protein [Thermodesulfobacteriota bacterium]
MNGQGGALLVISQGAMDLCWRYAWAFFLTFLSIGFQFPLYTAAGILAISAVLNRTAAKKGWLMYQVVLLNIIGFMVCALLFLHHFQYPAYPFWSLDWVGRLAKDPVGIVEWFFLLLTVFCLVLIWQGGRYLKKSPGDYISVCLQFDKGLGLLFALLIVNSLFLAKGGVGMPVNALGFLMPAYLIFGLASVGLSRNQYEVKKSFLSGYRGLGIIVSIAAMTILFGLGMAFLFHPYLYPAADALLTTLDQAATPMVPYLVRFIRYILVPKHRMNITGLPDDSRAGQIELSPPPTDGWPAAAANIMVWVTIGVVVLMIAVIMFYLFKRLLAWLLSEDSLDGQPLTFKAWILRLLNSLMAMPVHLWCFLASLFKRADSAAMVYVCLLRWGRRCGLSKLHNETPDEYGSRLMRHFPRLGQEIRLIVDTFDREIYGLVKTDPDMLIEMMRAQRRMKNIRHWPRRMKVWLVS